MQQDATEQKNPRQDAGCAEAGAFSLSWPRDVKAAPMRGSVPLPGSRPPCAPKTGSQLPELNCANIPDFIFPSV